MKKVIEEITIGGTTTATICRLDENEEIKLTIAVRHFDGYTGELIDESVYSSYEDYCCAEEEEALDEWDMHSFLIGAAKKIGRRFTHEEIDQMLGELAPDMLGAFPDLI